MNLFDVIHRVTVGIPVVIRLTGKGIAALFQIIKYCVSARGHHGGYSQGNPGQHISTGKSSFFIVIVLLAGIFITYPIGRRTDFSRPATFLRRDDLQPFTFTHAKARAFDINEIAMMNQPIEDGRCQNRIEEDTSPLIELFI